ncbi:MAG: hypothetical protein Q8Q81_00540 [Oxalobacteraceae bacterium]|nr:hypothetical protein [Oxalobacteraceae bacterium]
MSSIAVGQQCAGFQRATPICGNCRHEKRERDDANNRTTRSCARHGWLVLMSSSCSDHAYRPYQNKA